MISKECYDANGFITLGFSLNIFSLSAYPTDNHGSREFIDGTISVPRDFLGWKQRDARSLQLLYIWDERLNGPKYCIKDRLVDMFLRPPTNRNYPL